MAAAEDQVASLRDTLICELTKAVALPQTPWAQKAMRIVFGDAASRFARLGIGLDRAVAQAGVAAGARWVLPHFVKDYCARGVQNIPAGGPLVIASNHPGSYDSLVISAHVARSDYKIIVGDIPFFENLPHVSEHAIYAPGKQDIHGRMQVIRQSIRHLASGGALLIFARGGIEPDPAFMPAPDAEFHLWSRSLQIFLERVPQTRFLATVVSGVISRAAMAHPLTRLRKARPDRQRIAFMLQMMQQVWSGTEKFGLRPRVSFGQVLTPADAGGAKDTLYCVTESARALLQSHLQWQQETQYATI